MSLEKAIPIDKYVFMFKYMKNDEEHYDTINAASFLDEYNYLIEYVNDMRGINVRGKGKLISQVGPIKSARVIEDDDDVVLEIEANNFGIGIISHSFADERTMFSYVEQTVFEEYKRQPKLLKHEAWHECKLFIYK